MNQKTLKALRKMVKNLTAGSKIPAVQYQENTSKRKYVTAPEKITDVEKQALGDLYSEVKTVDKTQGRIQVCSGQIILDPKCAKAIYRHFKKQIKSNPTLASQINKA